MTHLTDEEIAAWLDGTLPSDEHARVIVHLSHCDECRGLMVEVSETLDETAEAPL